MLWKLKIAFRKHFYSHAKRLSQLPFHKISVRLACVYKRFMSVISTLQDIDFPNGKTQCCGKQKKIVPSLLLHDPEIVCIIKCQIPMPGGRSGGTNAGRAGGWSQCNQSTPIYFQHECKPNRCNQCCMAAALASDLQKNSSLCPQSFLGMNQVSPRKVQSRLGQKHSPPSVCLHGGRSHGELQCGQVPP